MLQGRNVHVAAAGGGSEVAASGEGHVAGAGTLIGSTARQVHVSGGAGLALLVREPLSAMSH